MKFVFAALFAASFFAHSAQADKVSSLKLKLAQAIAEQGTGACGNTNSELAFYTITAAGFSWNNLYNEGNALGALKSKLNRSSHKKLKAALQTNLAFKIASEDSYSDYQGDRLKALKKALPGTTMHERDVAGAVITYIELGLDNSVKLYAPQRQSEKVSLGTYELQAEGEKIYVQLKFSEEIASDYVGRYLLNDEALLASNYKFDTGSFEITMEVENGREFSSEQDITECADY